MTQNPKPTLQQIFAARYSDAPEVSAAVPFGDALRSMAARGSCRAFLDKVVPAEFLEILCAAAFASPTKSDLQQRDIILLQSPEVRSRLAAFVPSQPWVADAPVIAIFCGNNRRQRLIHEWQEIPFANDHLDAFFNAVADAAIALGAFVTAAEAVGLGCCPISAVRNEAAAVSELLALPEHVFPLAGLAVGYPSKPVVISKRLPLAVTRHFDRYSENGLQGVVKAYDRNRAEVQPYAQQRLMNLFGTKENYGWSDEKTRQYSQKERAEFGEYIRAQGFNLE